MLIDLYVEASKDGDTLVSDETRQHVQQHGIGGLVLVGEENLPNFENENVHSANLQLFAGAVLNVGDARLWAMPPSADQKIPGDLSDDPATVATTLANNGWAVLLCNPYARELPGGELRDRAVGLSDVHGLLSFTASAPLEENLLAQELAMARHKVAGAGTGKPASHPEFGRYFTLAIPEITTQKDLVLAIR